MKTISDLVGTRQSSFKVRDAELDSSQLTDKRVHELPDDDGTVALVPPLDSKVVYVKGGALHTDSDIDFNDTTKTLRVPYIDNTVLDGGNF